MSVFLETAEFLRIRLIFISYLEKTRLFLGKLPINLDKFIKRNHSKKNYIFNQNISSILKANLQYFCEKILQSKSLKASLQWFWLKTCFLLEMWSKCLTTICKNTDISLKVVGFRHIRNDYKNTQLQMYRRIAQIHARITS